ncbi:hypothetical protein ElyMa_004712300 [Elysia marginata]|uniref:Uncharacterized protein n=1 Tax=Elysia marginata TaxID=1093978 RepID=A0AAV4I926_9GAST|nr:hypothetical protein ElyMa_004712300 [Elysia marginata]
MQCGQPTVRDPKGDSLAHQRGTGPVFSEGQGYDNDVYFFPAQPTTIEVRTSGSNRTSGSQDSLHLLQGSSGSRLNVVGGASSIDSGIDYTGAERDGFIASPNKNWSLRRVTPLSKNKVLTHIGNMQIEGGDFSCNHAHQTIVSNRSNGAMIPTDVNKLEGPYLHRHDVDNNSSSSIRQSSDTLLRTFAVPGSPEAADNVEALGQVELELINPTYHLTLSTAKVAAETTDSFTRL